MNIVQGINEDEQISVVVITWRHPTTRNHGLLYS
jgi:hypothetical protein